MQRLRTMDQETVSGRGGREYEADFAGWAEDTALAIREGRWKDVDLESVAEEIASLGRSDKRSLRSALKVLLLHLLKQHYQPEKAGRSWERSIVNSRQAITQLIAESPSLQSMLDLQGEAMMQAYADARQSAAVETGFELDKFPAVLPFAANEIWGTK